MLRIWSPASEGNAIEQSSLLDFVNSMSSDSIQTNLISSIL